MGKCSIPKHWNIQNRLSCWPALKHHWCTDWCRQHEAENEIWLLPQFPDSRTNRWFTSLACFYAKFIFPASLSQWYAMMRKLQELNWKSSFQGQSQVNWCSEHLQFTFNWSVFFFREWTHPDRKEHTENNTIKVELNKQWKRNNYAAIMGICS